MEFYKEKFLIVLFLVFSLCTFISGNSTAQLPELSIRERDNLRIQAISLVKEYEQLLNVMANRGTTASDARDLITLATEDEQTRIFESPKVVLEDDLFSQFADSLSPKDVSIQKYLNDWDLFYTKTFDESVRFSDLRISDFGFKEYLFLKVQFLTTFKSRHRNFDQNYRPIRRIASIRFSQNGGKYTCTINGISIVRQKDKTPIANEEFKPFVKEHKIQLGLLSDSTITEAQMALQKKSDSLYAEALKVQMLKSEDQNRKDLAFYKAINRGDSLVGIKDFESAIEAYSEARSHKPLETYPRKKINELTKLLSGGSRNPRQMFTKLLEEGDLYFKQRDYESARQAYQSAYIILPDNPTVVEKFVNTDRILKNKVGIRHKYLAGNYKLALKDFQKIISEEPQNPDWYFERARCFQSKGEIKRAISDLNMAVGLDNRFIEALSLRAEMLQRLGDWQKAIADFNALIVLDPKNAENFQRKGIVLAQAKDWEKAITEFDKALALEPQDVQSATGKAESFRRLEKLDQALKAAEFAESINSGYESAIFQKAIILLLKGDEARAKTEMVKAYSLGLNPEEEKEAKKYYDDYVKSARIAAGKNQLEESINFSWKALIVKPNSIENLVFIAQQKSLLGKTDEAYKLLDQCLASNVNYVPAYLKKGQIAFGQKKMDMALQMYSHAYRLDKKCLEATHGIGDVYFQQGKFDSATVWYNEAFSIKSSSPGTLMRRGKCHYKTENFQRALLDFENAIREDNTLAEAHFYKGKINKINRQQGYTAIDNFNEAMKMGYSKYDCLMEIGLTFEFLEIYKQAIKTFSEAIAFDPKGVNAYVERGRCYLQKDDFVNAKADFEVAVNLDTLLTNADGFLELGFLNLRFSGYAGAEQNFTRILDFDPNHCRANYGLAVILYNQGKKEAAMNQFEKAFQTGKLEYSVIKKDPWMKEIIQDPAFIKVKDSNSKE